MYCEDAVRISLEGELDISREEELHEKLRPAEWADRAVLDFSRVSFVSTTVINALVRLHKLMQSHGRAGIIRIVGCAPHVRRIFPIPRLDRLFEVA